MPKRFSKNRNPEAKPASGRPERGGGAPANPVTGTAAADTESEFSVPPKWQENEEENASASKGPDSAARDGESSEEGADTRSS